MKDILEFIGQILALFVGGIIALFTLYIVFFPITVPITILTILLIVILK